ncbi:MAG: transposase [Ignavibacteria bacterium]
MLLIPETIYHFYDRGNNRRNIFFNEDNYLFFLRKIRKYLIPHCDILCYCLMPNHFHFMIYTKSDFHSDNFNNNCKTLLSSYTRAVNIQEDASGSLFQQHAKFKTLNKAEIKNPSYDANYPLICFNYIHQNPIKKGLVQKIEDWKYSSFLDYYGIRRGTLCNQDRAHELLNLPADKKELYEMTCKFVEEDKIKDFI